MSEENEMSYGLGVPHEGHTSTDEPCPMGHPMHIYRVRAQHAARSAEREMYRKVAKDAALQGNTPMGMIRRALNGEGEQP